VCQDATCVFHSVLLPKRNEHNSSNNSSGSTESNKLKVSMSCGLILAVPYQGALHDKRQGIWGTGKVMHRECSVTLPRSVAESSFRSHCTPCT
jgi:hypothetical protein